MKRNPTPWVGLVLLFCSPLWAKCENKNPSNKAGQQHGVVIYCYGNGGWEETTYVNGEIDGTKRTYSFEGKIETEIGFKGGKQNGPAKKWHRNGKLAEELTHKEYKEHGVKKEYSEEGNLKKVENYKEGELDGERKVFHDDGKFGKVDAIESYSGGKKQGLWRRFFENGKPREQRQYANNELDGEQKEFDEKGQLRLVEHFKDGKRHGWGREFYDNSDGYYLYSASFSQGGDRTLYATFHANGTLNEVTCYKNGSASEDRGPCQAQIAELGKFGGGKQVKQAAGDTGEFYANGKPRSKCPTKNGKRHGKCIRYFEDGAISWSGEYLDGVAHGKNVENFQSGKPKEESFFVKGEMVKLVQYYDEGQLKKTMQLKAGRELASKTLYQNGEVKEETEWKGKHQMVREYHDNGKLAVRATLVPSTNCLYGCYTTQAYEGKVERFDEKGRLFASGEWKTGRRHGRHLSFHGNGKVSHEEVYKDDYRVSEKQYDASGKLKQSVEYFKDGSRKVLKGT